MTEARSKSTPFLVKATKKSKAGSQSTAVDGLSVGDRIWFAEEKQAYTVQARSRRFLVCTKPFNLQKTVLYCIIDLKERVRGPENLIFGMGAETPEDCQDMIDRLEGRHDAQVGFRTEVSYRHRIPIVVLRVERRSA